MKDINDQKQFTIPLRLQGLQAYVITKACIFGLHGLDRTEVAERTVMGYFRLNHTNFVREGLTLEASVSAGYVLDQTKRERLPEKLELNGRSFVVRLDFSGYPAYLIDWHVSGGLYCATRRGVVSGLLDNWVLDHLHDQSMHTNIVEAERLGYIPPRTR